MDAAITTELGVFPSNWRVGRFDSIFNVQQGKQVSKANRVGENQQPFLRTKNVFWNRLELVDLDEMHFSEADELRLALKPDDLLICEGGDIGRTAIWRGAFSRCYYQNHLHRARIRDPKTADAQFVLFWLWYAFEFGHLYFGRGNVTTIPNLSQSKLSELPLAIPPLAEQRKIARVLALVQRAMEQQARLIALTTELKNTLLHQLFTQGLRGEPQKQTEIGPVPESWEMVPLEGVANIERGKFTHRPRNEPRFYGGQTPFVQTGEVSSCDGRIREYSQTLNEEGVLISKVFPAGTILITIAANIGFSGILEFDSACPDSLIGLTPNERIDVEFLQHYLTTQQPVMDRLAPRGTQKNINIQFLKPWLVPLPSSDEQSEIREALNVVDSKVRVTRRKHAALTALFRTLLHQLMTAHILVTDLDIME